MTVSGSQNQRNADPDTEKKEQVKKKEDPGAGSGPEAEKGEEITAEAAETEEAAGESMTADAGADTLKNNRYTMPEYDPALAEEVILPADTTRTRFLTVVIVAACVGAAAVLINILSKRRKK